MRSLRDALEGMVMAELPEIRIMRERCILCGDCIKMCPQSGEGVESPVLSDSGGGEVTVENRDSCIACYTCVEFCRASAIVVSHDSGLPDHSAMVFPERPLDRIV